MKKRFLLPLMIASLFTAVSFVSCSDEDDESAFEAAVASAKERNKEKPAENPAPTPPPQPVPQNVTVTFDVNGGTALATSEYTFVEGKTFQNGSGLNYLPITTKEGFEFQNWNTKADGTGSALTSIYQTINSSVTYYAYWKPLITNVTTSLTGSDYVTLGVGESKVYTFRYEPADATTNWSYNSRFNGYSDSVYCSIKDNHDGYVEYTLTGIYARHGIFTITESKSGKAYAIDVTVNAPANPSSIPLITPGTASSTNPADYAGLDKTLDSTTPLLLYRLELEANTSYRFQCASKNYQNTIDVEGLGYPSFSLYNSNLTDSVYPRSATGGFEYRPTTSMSCYLIIHKESWNSTSKGGVHVYKNSPVTAISLAQPNVNFAVGSDYQYIDVTITPDDAYKSISVTSSNYSVADGWYDDSYWNSSTRTYIRKLQIRPRAAGTATITIKDTASGKTATCDVTVTGTNVTNLALSQTTLPINHGETKNITVTPTPENATVSYYWYISDVGGNSSPCDGRIIADITQSGTTFTIKGGVVPGTVTLGVSDNYSGKNATCTITNNTGITASAVTDELPVGTAASTSLADYTIATVNNAQPVKYYKIVVPAANSGKKYNFQTASSGKNPIIGSTFVAGYCYFYLYDENFTLKSRWDSTNPSLNLTAGTYYFAIVYGSPNTTSTYTCRGGVHLYVTD